MIIYACFSPTCALSCWARIHRSGYPGSAGHNPLTKHPDPPFSVPDVPAEAIVLPDVVFVVVIPYVALPWKCPTFPFFPVVFRNIRVRGVCAPDVSFVMARVADIPISPVVFPNISHRSRSSPLMLPLPWSHGISHTSSERREDSIIHLLACTSSTQAPRQPGIYL